MKTTNIQQAQLEGHPSNINIYKEGRKCPFHGCITKLTLYTPGPYCNAHARQGMLEDLMDLDDFKEGKRLIQINKHKKASKKSK